MQISMKLIYQCRIIFFIFSPTSNHLHPLQVENSDSNLRLVVDEMTMANPGLTGLIDIFITMYIPHAVFAPFLGNLRAFKNKMWCITWKASYWSFWEAQGLIWRMTGYQYHLGIKGWVSASVLLVDQNTVIGNCAKCYKNVFVFTGNVTAFHRICVCKQKKRNCDENR